MVATYVIPYTTAIIFWLIILFSKKHITKMEMYTTTFFALYFEILANIILDIKYDLYGYFDKGVSFQTIPIAILLFSAVSILYLNFYPYRKSPLIQFLYIMICTIIGVFFEWVFLQGDFFYHNGWKLWYSFVSYPLIFYILTLNLRITRRLKRKGS